MEGLVAGGKGVGWGGKDREGRVQRRRGEGEVGREGE